MKCKFFVKSALEKTHDASSWVFNVSEILIMPQVTVFRYQRRSGVGLNDSWSRIRLFDPIR